MNGNAINQLKSAKRGSALRRRRFRSLPARCFDPPASGLPMPAKRCQSERMRVFRRKNEPEPPPDTDDDVSPTDAYYDDYEPSWYVPHDGDNQRFVRSDGLPAL